MPENPAQRDLPLIRAHYFLWIGAGGFLMPFASLFYKARGLSGTEIGLLSTFGALAGMLAAPLWGRWGDRSQNPVRLLQLGLLGAAGFGLLRGLQHFFWPMAACIVLEALVASGTGGLSNKAALQATHGEKAGFGSIRLWGSLGWAAAAPAAGWLIERTGLFAPFAGYAALLAATAIVLGFVRGRPDRTGAASPPQVPARAVLRGLIRSRPMTGLILAFVVIWLAGSGRQQFESLYMVQLGAAETTIGWVNTVSAMLEPPFMLLADRLTRRRGSGRVLRAAVLLQAAAFLPIVLAPSVASMFLLRIAFSVAFSLIVVGYINYLAENAPQGQAATVISLFEVTLRGAVSLAAAPLAGLIFDWAGAYWLYAVGLAGSLLAWLILGSAGRASRPAATARD
jgi:PPP family 3-phenylpropionic acid transporter